MKTAFEKYWERCRRWETTEEGQTYRKEKDRFQSMIEQVCDASKHPSNQKSKEALLDIARQLRVIENKTHIHKYSR